MNNHALDVEGSGAKRVKFVVTVTVLVALSLSAVRLDAQGQMQAPAPLAGPGPASPVADNALKAAIAREVMRLRTIANLAVPNRPASLRATAPALQEARPPIGTRVRVTAASEVELPGVLRMVGTTMTGPVLSSDEDSVTVRGAAGQVVTLPRPGHTIVGTIVGVEERDVTIARDRGSVVTVPRSAIAQLERSYGRRSRKRAAGLGFLIGAGGGAGVGFLSGSTRKCPGWFAPPGAPVTQSCFMEPVASTLAGVILGGGAGGLLGGLVHPGDRWTVVPVDWLMGR